MDVCFDRSTLQDTDFIQDLRIVQAKDRTYIQGWWGMPKGKHLVVEISEKMTKNHKDLIQKIANKIREGEMTKAMARNMREKLLEAEPK